MEHNPSVKRDIRKRPPRGRSAQSTVARRIKRHWQLYLLILVPFAVLIIFSYVPMYGIILAFKNFQVSKGILGSPWVGFEHFRSFFESYFFKRLITNTLALSIYGLIAGFPLPILLAIMINESRKKRFAKTVQMVTYAPYFISTVVLVSIMMLVLAPNGGIVNKIIEDLGGTRIDFFAQPKYFRHLYVWSGIWQGTGFSSVIYIAALSGVDPELHEAARVDGAGRIQRIWHVDLPCILPTIVILLILSAGTIMNVGFEKVLLMQTPLNRTTSDIISTYVYEIGIINSNYGLSTAVGLFNSVINVVLLLGVNQIARRFTDQSLV